MTGLYIAIVMLLGVGAAPAWAFDDRRSDAAPEQVFLPRGDLFAPLTADPKEPRFSAAYQRVNVRTGPIASSHRSSTINAGFVSAGANFGLWRRTDRGGADGVQVGVLGGVFSQFDLNRSSADLINTDFLVGIPVSVRRGAWSGRARLTHLSSHLGDEFIVRNRGVRVRNFGYEMVDVLVAREWQRLRLYAGAGAVFNSSTRFSPGVLQAGGELKPKWQPQWTILGLSPRTIVAVDFKSLEQQGWGGTWSVSCGLEFEQGDSNVRVRFLGSALAGYFPYAQFFDETRVDAIGMSMQVEL